MYHRNSAFSHSPRSSGVIERLLGHLPNQRGLRVILDVDPMAVL